MYTYAYIYIFLYVCIHIYRHTYIYRFSRFLLCCYVPSPVPIAILLALYYVTIGSYDSYKASIIILLLSCSAQKMCNVLGNNTWLAAVILQLFSCFIQLQIGHFYYEKNQPGMMKKLTVNSIVLSLLMAVDTTIIAHNVNSF
jgi:uncharacterized membrane protein YGL010W